MISKDNLDRFISQYKDDYPKKILKWCEQGKSIESFAATIDCIPQIFPLWMKMYPEFERAVHIGYWKAYKFWEEKAELGVHDKYFNSTTYSMVMKQRFKWASIKEEIIDDIKRLSDEELEERVKVIMNLPTRKQLRIIEEDEE